MFVSFDTGRVMHATKPSGKDFSIRPALEGDIPQVVNVHLASFQNFFLTFLGRSFLERLYQEIVIEPGGVFLVATSPEKVVIGFAAGVPDLSGFYRRLARGKWVTFGLASVRAALRRPLIIPRLWRALKAADQAEQASCPATLMSIAVAPDSKRAGVGKSLIAGFLDGMRQQGIRRLCLNTDRDNNAATIGFYEQLGFMKTREFQTREGRWVCEFLIDAL